MEENPRATQTPVFVQVNNIDYKSEILVVSMEYFEWMSQEIASHCNCSLPEIVGRPLEQYLQETIGVICSGVPPHGIFYLMKEGSKTVGFGGLRRLPDGDVELVRVFTREQFRGRGYGRQLLQRLLIDASSFGYSVVKLDTGMFMRSAHRIYESFGFVDCPPYEGAEAPPELIPYWRYMIKTLA